MRLQASSGHAPRLEERDRTPAQRRMLLRKAGMPKDIVFVASDPAAHVENRAEVPVFVRQDRIAYERSPD